MATLSSKLTLAPLASFAEYKFTGVAGQTVFTGVDDNSSTLSYLPRNIIITLNGVVLEGSDFTATNGETITLVAPVAEGDEVVIKSLSSFAIADTYTKAEIDTSLAAIPSTYLSWSVKTGAYTAANGDQIAANGTFTVTLPATPSVGDTVVIANVGSGTITVGRNGSNINSLAEDGTLNADASAQLVYIDGTIGWKEI